MTTTMSGWDRMNPWQPAYADDTDGPDPFDGGYHTHRSEDPVPEHRHATAAARQADQDEPETKPNHLSVAASPEDRNVAVMALSVILEATDVGLSTTGQLKPGDLTASDLIEALNRLRGPDGIISAYQTLERELEDALSKMLPRDQKRPEHAQKWTNVDGWRLERTSSGQWTIESKRALERLFGDLGDQLDPVLAADLVVNHISGLDTSWKVTELRASLGGDIEQPVMQCSCGKPGCEDDVKPVLLQRGPNKGQPKTEKLDRLVEEEWGERAEGRDRIRIHKGDA